MINGARERERERKKNWRDKEENRAAARWKRGVIPSNRSLFSLGLRLTPDSLKLESPQESQRCRPMRFGILEPFQATFE